MTPPPLFRLQSLKHLAAAVLSVLVGLGGVLILPATAAGAVESDSSGVSVTRYGGADRYETSLQVAEAVVADTGRSLDSVVLVSGRRWTDAVVAAPVAGALGAPVLMTPPGELRADALEFLRRVGVSKALVVGPDASGGGRGVGAGVLEALEGAGISAERVAGDDRYGTGVAAARRVTPGAMGKLGRTAVIASGEVFADALVAGPFAARGIHPVLLTSPDELHADVAGYLDDADIEHVVLMGGTAALGDSVERSVRNLGIEVSRVAGSTRYDTAVKAAELIKDRYTDVAGRACFSSDTIGMARARVPFDSFSAAPLLGRLCAPLVLADPDDIPIDTAIYLDVARRSSDSVRLQIFGGDAAISQAAVNAYLSCQHSDAGDPPYPGTVWVTPDILDSADPSSLGSVSYSGRGTRDIFDRRVNAWITVDAYLFEARFGDQVVEFQVNPEFGSKEAAREQVDRFAPAIGRLPAVLTSELREVEMNAGAGLFGGNSWNRSFLIHTDDPATQAALSGGFLEEVFLHEGAHVALDPSVSMSAGWRSAQQADGIFISEYARDFPDREDVAESFLAYYAIRRFPDRLTAQQACVMRATIPNRHSYFDEQQFDLSTQAATPASTASLWTLSGTVDHGWSDPLTSGRDIAMASDIEGAVVEITDGPNAGRQTVTDERGRWALRRLEQARVTVRVTAKGFAPAKRTLDLTADTDLPFAMSRKLPSPEASVEFPETDPDYIEAVAPFYPYVHRVGNIRVFSDISPEFSRRHAEHGWKVWAFFDDLYAVSPNDYLDAYYTTDSDVIAKLGTNCGVDAAFAEYQARNTRVVFLCNQWLGSQWDYGRWFIIPFQIPDFGTQLHEFGHDFFFKTWPGTRSDRGWFIEGSAMYFEAGVFGDSLRIAEPLGYCTILFDRADQQGQLIPVGELITLEWEAFWADPHRFYPLSCMLFHYVELHHPGVLYSVIDQINSRGITTNDQLIDALLRLTGMSVRELNDAWVAYSREAVNAR